jgi:hypothetical protein
MLFGAVGGVFAAPLLKIAVDARLEMKAAGLFASSPAAGSAGRGPTPGEASTGPPGRPAPADDPGQGEDPSPAGA